MEPRFFWFLLAAFLAMAPLVGLLLLRYKLTKESEPGSSLKITDLLLMGSSSWARGTNMDVEWRQNASRQPSEDPR
jgi:hypothetical protein